MNTETQNYKERLEAAEHEIEVLKQQIMNLEASFLTPSASEVMMDALVDDHFNEQTPGVN